MCWPRSKGLLFGSHIVINGRERWNRHFMFVCLLSMSSHEHALPLAKASAFRHNVSVEEETEKKEAQCSAIGATLWAFYKLFPSFSFTIMLFLHTSLSFAIDIRSGGSESPSFIWDRFPLSELFPSFHARKDELPASRGAELVLNSELVLL